MLHPPRTATRTPPRSGRDEATAAWTPWSADFMATRRCVACRTENLVVKCGECSAVGVETWYCPGCLETDDECRRCCDRAQTAAGSIACGAFGMSSVGGAGGGALDYHRDPMAGVGRDMLARALEVSDTLTTWLPDLIGDAANFAWRGMIGGVGLGISTNATEVETRPPPPARRPPPPEAPPPPPGTPPPGPPLASAGARRQRPSKPSLSGQMQTPWPSQLRRHEPPQASEGQGRRAPAPPSAPPPEASAAAKFAASAAAAVRAEARASHPLTAILARLRASAEAAAEAEVCAVCLEPPEDPVALPCRHAYCARCVAALRERQVLQLCPLCRHPMPLGTGDALYDAATRLFVPVQRAVERGKCSWGALPPHMQGDLDKSMALLKQASSSGHPEARTCLGIGKRVVIAGLAAASGDQGGGGGSGQVGNEAEYVDAPGDTGVDVEHSDSAPSLVQAPRRRGAAPGSCGSGGVASGGGQGGFRRARGGAELNGQVGIATAFDDGGNCFVVTLKDSGQRVRVKPANIRMER